MWHLLMVAAVAMAFCAPAGAMPVTYAWTGTVTENNSGFPGVSVGETIPISLTLNNAVANQSAAPDVGVYSSAFGVPPLILAVNIGGVTSAGSFQTVDVFDNHMGIDEFLISTGTPLTGCCFTILFETSHVGVLTSNAIPLFIDPTKFEMATFSEHLFPSVGGSFSGTIDSAVPVPEPAGLMLFGSGLLAIIFLRFGPLGWIALRVAPGVVDRRIKPRDTSRNCRQGEHADSGSLWSGSRGRAWIAQGEAVRRDRERGTHERGAASARRHCL